LPLGFYTHLRAQTHHRPVPIFQLTWLSVSNVSLQT
jgi:hypothetical protein